MLDLKQVFDDWHCYPDLDAFPANVETIQTYIKDLKTYESASGAHLWKGICMYVSRVSPLRFAAYDIWSMMSGQGGTVARAWDYSQPLSGKTPERIAMVRDLIQELEEAINVYNTSQE